MTDSSGKLQATQVQFAEKSFVEIQADVQSVDTSAKSLSALLHPRAPNVIQSTENLSGPS